VQGKYDKAETLYKRAIAIGEKSLGPNHPDLATLLNNFAKLLCTRRKYAEARPLVRRALKNFEAKLGANHAYTKYARVLMVDIEACSLSTKRPGRR